MALSGSSYFAVKVFMPRVSEKKAFASTLIQPSVTEVTVPNLAAASDKSQPARAGAGVSVGVEGHLGAVFLPFSEKENAACKTLAEAEKLVKDKHKAWLVDAYDWFVTRLGPDTAPAKKAAKKKSK